MTRRCCRWSVFPVCITGLLLLGGCGEGEDQGPMGPPGGGGPDAAGLASPGIKQIMVKLARGPQSLTPVIGNELGQDPPPWETIQGHTKEYSEAAAEMGKYDPPRGAKQSWMKLTTEFADTASEMDRAAVAKDKERARAAHEVLKNSCNACHKEHRRMGRGGGGPPGGPGGPPGGPGGPPGRPAGPPPDRPQ